jgi:hypothetical protein
MTSTELQVHDADQAPAIERANEVDYGGLLALARELVPTGFLPDHIKTPGQAVAIILTGRELGMLPMRALRSLTMVKGKVVENADSQLARFKADGGRSKWITLDETKAVLWLKMRNGDETTSTFTLEDARRAELLNNSSWKKYPKAMLRSRAITQGLKDLGWEGGVGAYDPEELGVVMPDSTAEDIAGTREEQATTAPSNGKPKPAREKRMPMGHSKGKMLGDLDTKDLESAAKWCRENNKFPDLVSAIADVLAERQRDQGKLELDAKQAGGVAPPDSPVGKKGDPAPTPSGPAREADLSKPRNKWSAAQLTKYGIWLLEHEPSLTKLSVETLPMFNGLLMHDALVTLVTTLEDMVKDAGAARKAEDDSDGVPF